jgi:hypothetical protein
LFNFRSKNGPCKLTLFRVRIRVRIKVSIRIRDEILAVGLGLR